MRTLAWRPRLRHPPGGTPQPQSGRENWIVAQNSPEERAIGTSGDTLTRSPRDRHT
jgi:hypothetical protein